MHTPSLATVLLKQSIMPVNCGPPADCVWRRTLSVSRGWPERTCSTPPAHPATKSFTSLLITPAAAIRAPATRTDAKRRTVGGAARKRALAWGADPLGLGLGLRQRAGRMSVANRLFDAASSVASFISTVLSPPARHKRPSFFDPDVGSDSSPPGSLRKSQRTDDRQSPAPPSPLTPSLAAGPLRFSPGSPAYIDLSQDSALPERTFLSPGKRRRSGAHLGPLEEHVRSPHLRASSRC